MSKAGGQGSAGDPEIRADSDEAETQEEHDARIRAKRIEQADAAVESAKQKVERAKADTEGAAASLKQAEAHRASLEG